MYQQRGEVSLFVVIFATLLLTIVTISFARIMMHDQQQASTIDLSQSAYDSAQAGVEDAKRAILHYQVVCSLPGANPTNPATPCGIAASQINSQTCNAFAAAGGLNDVVLANDGGREVKIQNTEAKGLDQAYTCNKITLNTKDYVGSLSKDSYDIIPLIGLGNFDKVRVNWFTNSDYQSPTPSSFGSLSLLSPSSGVPLLPSNATSWSPNRPPILRTQLIQFGSSFTLDDFESGSAATGSNANTLFLYPSGTSGVSFTGTTSSYTFVGYDNRQLPTGKPYSVSCSGNISSGGYACTAILTLPNPISGNASNRTAFLRLGALYNPTSYQVSMIDTTGGIVNFDSVQPMIDSTGRANSLFRRVQARVRLSSDFQYPSAEVHTNGSLCKNFLVTDDATKFSENNVVNGNSINGCTP